MYYYKRLIALIAGILIVILFAGAAALFVTPYDEWFISLETPSLMTSQNLHSVLWFFVYLLIAVAISSTIVGKRNKREFALWLVVIALSVVYTAFMFTLKNPPLAALPLSLAAILTVVLFFHETNLSRAVIACWYVYLLAVQYGYIMLN